MCMGGMGFCLSGSFQAKREAGRRCLQRIKDRLQIPEKEDSYFWLFLNQAQNINWYINVLVGVFLIHC